jgi:hypothetical protein
MMDLMSSPRLAALQPDWTFTPTAAPWRVQIARHRERLRGRVAAPASEVLVPPKGEGAWIVYFVYLPEGRLDPAHRFALDRLRALGRRLLVVCAATNAAAIPAELSRAADALLWKALPGFDFSAYALGLRSLAEHCPGSDALVLNDSTFGPLVDFRPWLDRARWDLTGFTATSNVENHVQSYAFHLRDVTPKRLGALTSVMPRRHAFNHFWAVVLWQETRFARVAAKSMSVGSFLYADTPEIEDPTLQVALPLVAAGFPFLKRSLLGKLSHVAEREETLATLAAVGYPV